MFINIIVCFLEFSIIPCFSRNTTFYTFIHINFYYIAFTNLYTLVYQQTLMWEYNTKPQKLYLIDVIGLLK